MTDGPLDVLCRLALIFWLISPFLFMSTISNLRQEITTLENWKTQFFRETTECKLENTTTYLLPTYRNIKLFDNTWTLLNFNNSLDTEQYFLTSNIPLVLTYQDQKYGFTKDHVINNSLVWIQKSSLDDDASVVTIKEEELNCWEIVERRGVNR